MKLIRFEYKRITRPKDGEYLVFHLTTATPTEARAFAKQLKKAEKIKSKMLVIGGDVRIEKGKVILSKWTEFTKWNS